MTAPRKARAPRKAPTVSSSAMAALTTSKAVAPPKPKPFRVVLSFAYHGGGCCGMSHLSNFTTTMLNSWAGNVVLRDEHVRNSLNDLDILVKTRTSRPCGCVEVVLTDSQMVQNDYFWHKALIERDFVRVTRFLNSNSGNYCNIYHQPYGQVAKPSADPLANFKA